MGRLAVDSATENDTIHLFIVVRPRRLWLARRLIHKACQIAAQANVSLTADYIVSTRALAIEEQSTVVALELAHMVPIVGGDVCRSVYRSNPWILDHLPNAEPASDRGHLSAVTPSRKQRWLEWLLLLPPFRLVENWERRRNSARLRRSSKTHTTSCSTEVDQGTLATTAAEVEAAWRQRLQHVAPFAGDADEA